jgi:hypothetical protein
MPSAFYCQLVRIRLLAWTAVCLPFAVIPVRTETVSQPFRITYAYVRDDDQCVHPVPLHTLQDMGRHPQVRFVLL